MGKDRRGGRVIFIKRFRRRRITLGSSIMESTESTMDIWSRLSESCAVITRGRQLWRRSQWSVTLSAGSATASGCCIFAKRMEVVATRNGWKSSADSAGSSAESKQATLTSCSQLRITITNLQQQQQQSFRRFLHSAIRIVRQLAKSHSKPPKPPKLMAIPCKCRWSVWQFND